MILWLKLIHILSAMIWFGGGLMLFFFARRARASGEPRTMSDFARTIAFVGPRVLAPAVIVLPVTGVWMVLDNAGYDFERAWVRIGIGLFIAALLVGAVYLGRLGVQMARADGSALAALFDRWFVGYVVVLAILLLAIWDMVFKPAF